MTIDLKAGKLTVTWGPESFATELPTIHKAPPECWAWFCSTSTAPLSCSTFCTAWNSFSCDSSRSHCFRIGWDGGEKTCVIHTNGYKKTRIWISLRTWEFPISSGPPLRWRCQCGAAWSVTSDQRPMAPPFLKPESKPWVWKYVRFFACLGVTMLVTSLSSRTLRILYANHKTTPEIVQLSHSDQLEFRAGDGLMPLDFQRFLSSSKISSSKTEKVILTYCATSHQRLGSKYDLHQKYMDLDLFN